MWKIIVQRREWQGCLCLAKDAGVPVWQAVKQMAGFLNIASW